MSVARDPGDDVDCNGHGANPRNFTWKFHRLPGMYESHTPHEASKRPSFRRIHDDDVYHYILAKD